jgi:chromosome segregation protein
MSSTIDKLADERDNLRVAHRKVLDELSQTRNKIQVVREELQKLRSARDGLNETVKALKQTRTSLQTETKQKLTVLNQLLRKMSDRPHASLAEKELAELEWKVQTDTLDKEEEKKLMMRIRSLETKVTAYHKVQKLRGEVTKTRDEADKVHQRIQELATESQKHHEEILQLSEAFNKLRLRKIDETNRLCQIKEKIGEVNEQYVDVKHMLNETEKRLSKEKATAFREALKTSAKKKADQGGKLSLQELAVLMEEEQQQEEE